MTYRDTPTERRVSDLRYQKRPELAEELAFLEEYLRWRNSGGPAALEARLEAARQNSTRWRAGFSDQAVREKPEDSPA